MKSFKNKVLLGLMVLPLFILPSCIDEPDCSLNNDKLVDVKLTITLPEPISKSVNTKAPRTDYNTVNDINVLVFNSSNTLEMVYYFDGGAELDAPFGSINPALPLNSSAGENSSTTITIVKVLANYQFYLVANHGSRIASVSSITDLENLQQTTTNGIPDKCMMYARAEADPPGSTTNYKAELKRTLAMVTVEIDGSNLGLNTTLGFPTNGEIKIVPKSIRLRNVPKTCIIASNIPNIGTSTTNVSAGDEAIVTSWPTLTSATLGNKTAGGHEDTAVPLFQFENKQGDHALGTGEDQTYKSTNKDEDASYLEVEAFYQYYESGTISKSGTIIYKFCLGSNIDINYDVIRNTHYRVTLQLSGWGGALEDGHINGSGVLVVDGSATDVGWRVDLSLRDWGFLQDEFNYDSHASYDLIQSNGNGFNIDFESGYTATNWVKFKEQGRGHWGIPSGRANWDDDPIAGSSNPCYKIYILPWKYPENDPSPNLPYRETKLEIQHNNGGPIQIVTIRQWKPILLEDGLYMERFEEEGNSLAWGYTNNSLSNTQSGYTFTFNGAEANGWNNTLYLYNKNGSPMSPAAQLCMKKAGYDLTGIPGDPLVLADKAAYYMPSKDELGKVIGYVGDPTDPYQYHDPIKTTLDYWSSSAPSLEPTYTYYWDHVTTPQVSPVTTITKTTNTRNTARQVRCVYRPSLNPTAGALSPFIQ
ncbi:MAG: hypothetical protein PHO36_13055 [Parabacteroides sp.]|nr:hypothetical protein [Parabacteroides sp.]